MDSTKVFDEHRGLLFSIAYRMLGSAADAEDMVQDAFLRWQQAPEQEVESPRAYLSTTVTRLCINHLQSAKVQREQYIGPWLPEPVASGGPDQMTAMADSLSMAFLVLLENLSPIERAVFLLREVFDYEFSEIARTVQKSEANCRQILRRARVQLGNRRKRKQATREQKNRLLQQFVNATIEGKVEELLSLLAEDITLYSDGGGKAAAALNPIYGATNVSRFLMGILKKSGEKITGVRIAEVNGEPAILMYLSGELNSVTFIEVADSRIQKLFTIAQSRQTEEVVMKRWDIFVVGGGLAGLTSALILARAGKRVALFERASNPGGRAVTQNHNGYLLNLGPHGLYLGGAAISVLRELEIDLNAVRVGSSGAFLYNNQKLHTLSGNPLALLTSQFAPFRARVEALRFLASALQKPAEQWSGITVDQWLQKIKHEDARNLLKAFVRVSSYTNAPQLQSAGMAAEQLQSAFKHGVSYLDGGWQSMVNALRQNAEEAGVSILTNSRVDRLLIDNHVRGVVLSDGSLHEADSVVLALGPKEASALVPENERLRIAAESSIPVRVATLDVALRELPNPHRTFALGVDRPYYYSVHSRWAKLTPGSGGVIHIAKYLELGTQGSAEELESFLEILQPRWRDHVVERRFLPSITVNSAVVTAKQGGFTGRPAPDFTGIPGLFVAGDWVGDTGFLADASMASARAAAHAALLQPSLQSGKVA